MLGVLGPVARSMMDRLIEKGEGHEEGGEGREGMDREGGKGYFVWRGVRSVGRVRGGKGCVEGR